MNFEQYLNKYRYLYDQFSGTVKNIIEIAIKNHEHSFHLQQIQNRAKSNGSLQKKLNDRGIIDSQDIEKQIKDLAGCRIIFYYNDDVNAFLNSGVIRDNFEIDWNESKIFHPGQEADSANDFYMAHHYVVKLKEDRENLAEYAQFKGLRCEIQIHTVLNHAWSETTHDITYKKDKAKGFGSKAQESIDKRLKKVMEDYIRPAGYEFQKIQHDLHRLNQGKDFLDRDIAETIRNSPDNNNLYEILERYKDYVIPHYDDITTEIDEIIGNIKVAVSQSKTKSVIPIETPFGSLYAKIPKDILEICSEILGYLRYVDIEKMFETAIELYLNTETKDEKKLIEDLVQNLSSYNMNVLRQVGTHVQKILISKISTWDDENLKFLSGIARTICEAVLNPVASGQSNTYRTFTWKRQNLIGNDELSHVRNEAIEILKRLYIFSKTESEKKNIIQIFNAAFRTPHMGEYGDNLLKIILENCDSIVNFYVSICPSELYEILEGMEEDVLFLYRRSNQIIKQQKISDEVKQIAHKTISAIQKFRNLLELNDKFIIYKTLVGFESVFPQDWDDESGYKDNNEFRESKIKEYIESIKPENEGFWEEIIVRCTRTESNDLATFPLFGKFINQLAQHHPSFILRLLQKYEQELSRFLVAIFDGLINGGRKDEAREHILSFIKNGKHLFSCAKLFQYNSSLDISLLITVLDKAIEISDKDTLIQISSSCVALYINGNRKNIEQIFLPAIKQLTTLNDSRWVESIWWHQNLSNFLSDLSDHEYEIVFQNLLARNSIDYHAERILLPMAKKNPARIISFFGDRLKSKEEGSLHSRYEAVPYGFQDLAEPLSKIPKEALDIVSSWYDGDYGMFIYRGGRLLNNIFPQISPPLEQCLIDKVRRNEEADFMVVMAILRNYDGDPSVQNACKYLILALPEDSELLDEVDIILRSTGTVSGEFGFVEAYERKKQEVQAWLADPDEKIQNFARQYITNLDKSIASERRRAEEDIELRKHRFGDDDNANVSSD